MKLQRLALAALAALALSSTAAFAQATQMPLGEQCFQATSGINGMVGALGTITGGTGGTTGTYGGVALTGGSGSGATANITVAGGVVTAVAILNPGTQYVVGDTLSAASGNIGGTTGFSVPVNSVSVNSAVAGGSVGYYIPSTLTPKQTWQDSGETIPNANPITLDQNGCALVYGSGTYRQILQDSLGNTIWDQLTTAPAGSANFGPFWGGTSTGTANAQIITGTGFAATDGQLVAWVSGFNNTGATTLNANGTGALSIVKDTASGSLPLAGGELVSGNVYQATYVASSNSFHIPIGQQLPTGSIVDWGGSSAPAGFLFANGACVSQSTYSGLYAIVGTTFGAGCGGGLFQLPDYRGRVGAGLDNMGGSTAGRLTAATMTPNAVTLGATGGIEGSAITIGQLPLFTPTGTVTVNFPGLTYTTVTPTTSPTFALGGATAYQQFATTTATTSADGPTSFTLSMAPIGSGLPTYVVQPTLIVNKIIKF